MRPALALLVLLACGACGKESVHEQTTLAPAWDAPTPANGFKPVAETCTKIDAAGQIQSSLAGTLEDIAPVSAISAVAADDRYVYFGRGKAIFRAERAPSPWPSAWKVEPIIAPLADDVTDLAVTRGAVHWVSATLGRTSRGHLDLATRATDFAVSEEKPIAKLVARGDTVFWSTSAGVFARRDNGATLALTSTPSPVVAANADDVFMLTAAGFFTRLKRPRSLVAADGAVDAIADDHFLYWIERGPETPPDDECDRCSTGYRMKGQPQHARGKLRRVPLAGGAPTDLYVGLPNVEHLTMLKGALWISTKQGLLRYDPTCHLPPARVAAAAGLHGRAVPFGESVAVLGERPEPHVGLLASP
jgi:hypothetical protein